MTTRRHDTPRRGFSLSDGLKLGGGITLGIIIVCIVLGAGALLLLFGLLTIAGGAA